jgi:hypothetical protein
MTIPVSSRYVTTYLPPRRFSIFSKRFSDSWRMRRTQASDPFANSGWSSSFQAPTASRSAYSCSRLRISRSSTSTTTAVRFPGPATLGESGPSKFYTRPANFSCLPPAPIESLTPPRQSPEAEL